MLPDFFDQMSKGFSKLLVTMVILQVTLVGALITGVVLLVRHFW